MRTAALDSAPEPSQFSDIAGDLTIDDDLAIGFSILPIKDGKRVVIRRELAREPDRQGVAMRFPLNATA